ncbi:glycerol-3-phosphate responsive antiterminator [Ornithinibacillus caprae]
MKQYMVDLFESQIIATITTPEQIPLAIESHSNVTFLLAGDLLTSPSYINELKDAGMIVFIHLDLIEGLANDRSAIRYVAKNWKPDGIITTKTHLIKFAKDEGMLTVQRLFLIDQHAVQKGIEIANKCQPDAIEVLPGIMPRVTYEITEKTRLPVIVGGLIKYEDEIHAALRAGALAASLSDQKLWNLGI